jgi:hypothetical protein
MECAVKEEAQLVATEVATDRQGNKYLVALVPSSSNPSVRYRVDATNGRCDCPAWKFRPADSSGRRKPCKHLITLGYTGDYAEGTVEKVKKVMGKSEKIFPSLTKEQLENL